MRETPRGMAVEILNRVERTGAYAEPLLDARLSAHYLPNIHDRRLLTELVYGVLRMRGHLDWLIRKLFRGPFTSLDREVKNIVRTSLYQLIYTNRIPIFAVVDEAVKLAKVRRPASAGLVNAILRNYIRTRDELIYPTREDDPLAYIAVVHSHPEWLVKQWLQRYGIEETIAFCAANNEIPAIVLRTNKLKAAREKVREALREEGVETAPTTFSPYGLVVKKHGANLRETDSYKKGHIQMQDEASQLIPLLLSPGRGEHVLDACAGAGIKATQLAELMGNVGKIVALDINEKKLASLQALTGRLGIEIVETRVGDAADLGVSCHESFDKILVDAPCSGLGTLGRNPEIKWRVKASDINGYSLIQKKILHGAAQCLKEGGRLVYSVCTITPEENEAVIEDFLSLHPQFHLAPLPDSIDLSMRDERGFFRTSPVRHGTDGFFGAILVK